MRGLIRVTKIIFGIGFSLLITLYGCNTQQETPKVSANTEQKIIIKKLDDQIVGEITEKSKLESFLLALSNKKEVILKKKPDFDAKIFIIKQPKKEEWLYSIHGYITEANKTSQTIYKISPIELNSIINP